MNLLTVSVSRTSQLEVGAFYLIAGSRHGFPLPPQVIWLSEKDIHPTFTGVGHVKGTLFWRMWDTIGTEHNHLITLYELNLPEHGDHDVHLERISEETIRKAVGAPGYVEVQLDQQQKLKRALKQLLDEQEKKVKAWQG